MSAALDYTVTSITQHTGAEVRGLDLREVCDDATAQRLRRVLADKGMIVFRDQTLDPPAFQRAVAMFGEIMPQTPPAKIVTLLEVILAFFTVIFLLSDFISLKDSLRGGRSR